MTDTLTTDVAILGGGPGGYTAAFRAADLGRSVCLIEQRPRLGGVCLNAGCIPSKTLLHGAAVIEAAAGATSSGITFGAPEIDLDTFRDHKDSIISQLSDGLDQLCKARKITRLHGHGMLNDTKTILVSTDNNKVSVEYTDLIIATGSRPATLPGLPDDPRIWTSTDALALTSVPQRLLVIGGGIIGLEMAEVYSALGSQITIVEALDHIVPPADKDMIQPLLRKLKQKYTIHVKTRVTAIKAESDNVLVEFTGPKAGQTEAFDAVLVAVGRQPNTIGFGLEHLGVNLEEQGWITVNERQETTIPNIYAIGDVVGEPMLAHKATHQGKVAAEVIAGHKAAFTPLTIPSVAYTSPELAWMGMTEKEAKEKGVNYVKGKFPWGASGRALSAGAGAGVSKVLFDKQSGRIIGAGICGLNAGELIHEGVLALEMGADAEDISKTVHAHPTLAETFCFAAEIVNGSITDLMPKKK